MEDEIKKNVYYEKRNDKKAAIHYNIKKLSPQDIWHRLYNVTITFAPIYFIVLLIK